MRGISDLAPLLHAPDETLGAAWQLAAVDRALVQLCASLGKQTQSQEPTYLAALGADAHHVGVAALCGIQPAKHPGKRTAL